MTDEHLLALLRADLEQPSPTVNDYLMHLIDVSKERIEKTGIVIDEESHGDAGIIVMYAAWLYRKRKTQESMSRMLRSAINDRLFSQKGKVNDDDG